MRRTRNRAALPTLVNASVTEAPEQTTVPEAGKKRAAGQMKRLSEGASGEPGSTSVAPVSRRLEKAITELHELQNLLQSGQGLDDPGILTDFRDAVSRVRNVAWSAQQYLASKATEQDATEVLSVCAGERVRVAYQLCQAIEADMRSDKVKFQKGQLVQLCLAATSLVDQLSKVVGKLG